MAVQAHDDMFWNAAGCCWTPEEGSGAAALASASHQHAAAGPGCKRTTSLRMVRPAFVENFLYTPCLCSSPLSCSKPDCMGEGFMH